MTDLGEWGIVDLDDEPDLEQESSPQLYYRTVEAFVSEQLAQTYRRELEGPGRTWCAEWWRHAEAIARLEALWRAWEHLRLDPATGISVWFRDHADHHMAVLLDPDGPFKGCSQERGHSTRLEPLPTSPAPEGVFEEDAVVDPFDAEPPTGVFDDEPPPDAFDDEALADSFDDEPQADAFDDDPSTDAFEDADFPEAFEGDAPVALNEGAPALAEPVPHPDV